MPDVSSALKLQNKILDMSDADVLLRHLMANDEVMEPENLLLRHWLRPEILRLILLCLITQLVRTVSYLNLG